MKRLFILLSIVAVLLLSSASVVLAQEASQISVTLLDGTLPVSNTEITLILIVYSDLAVEQNAIDTCRTDSNGQCIFFVADPSRLIDGHAEAFLDVDGIGRSWIGWEGDRADVVLTVSDLNLAATVTVPNELGYEYETPGAYNSPLYTEEPQSIKPTLSATKTQIGLPPSTAEPRQTATPSTVTPPTVVSPLDAPKIVQPVANEAPSMGIATIGCGAFLFVICAFLVWLSWQQKRGIR